MSVVDIYNTNKKYNIIYADPPWKYNNWSQATKSKKHFPRHIRKGKEW